MFIVAIFRRPPPPSPLPHAIQTLQAHNVEVPELNELIQGGFAGNADSAGSMAGRAVRGVDESGAGEPLREGREKLEQHANSGKGDLTMMKLGSE